MLETDGWQHIKTVGDHFQFKHPARSGKVTVTHPVKDIPIRSLPSIYRQAGWDWSQRK